MAKGYAGFGGMLVTEKFDKVLSVYPSGTVEEHTYSNKGNFVALITITYDDSTKLEVVSQIRT